LTPEERSLVLAILRETLADAEVYAFGSRATGRARPFSDLDLLVVREQALSLGERAALRDSFERSTLPYRVDIVDSAGLSGAMAARVAQERVRL
jgi:predicted nucleotidyltransferase